MKHVFFFFMLAIISSLSAQSQDTTDYHLEIILQDEYGIEKTEVDSISITVFNEDKLCDTYPSRVYEPALMRVYFDYDFNHPSFGNNDGAFKNGYQVRMSNHNMFGISKRWDMGAINSFDWGWQQIDSLAAPAFENELDRARYSWFKWGLGLTNTLMISGVKTDDDRDDFILNFGATWNVPLFFRYTEVNGSTKQFKRGIHKWNEFQAEARLTYGAVGFGATYRLTEYLKGDYPQMPRLMLSLTLTAPTI